MSIILESIERINGHVTNNSLSKQMYSFPKANRFNKKKIQSTEYSYNIPDTKTKRTTTLGYGKRYDFVNDYVKNACKSPYYNIESSFKKFSQVKNIPSGSVVKTPQFYKKKYNETGEKIVDFHVPGPGAYEVRKPPGKDSLKISLSFRLNKSNSSKCFAEMPGPGQYKVATDAKYDGKLLSSQLRNSASIKFDKSPRFIKKKIEEKPGPGTYKSITSFNGHGYCFLSTVRSSSARSILSKVKNNPKHNQTPGPGYYRIPSEFGIYVSKKAIQKSASNLSLVGNTRTLNSSMHLDNSYAVINNMNNSAFNI